LLLENREESGKMLMMISGPGTFGAGQHSFTNNAQEGEKRLYSPLRSTVKRA